MPPLWRAKVAVPRRPAAHVVRERLFERLDRALACPVTLVSAPPGWGKTTLVAAWVERLLDRWRVAWLSLDEEHAETARLLRDLAAAVHGRDPRPTGPGGLGPIEGSARDAIETLFDDALAGDDALIVVLDDYHHVKDPEVHRALALIAERAPDRLRLVVVSRHEPPLPLGRWRANKVVDEIGQDELQFSNRETSIFLRETMGLALDERAIGELERSTEGWIAALQMAALSIRQQGGSVVPSQVGTFSGRHRYVIDYVATEVLSALRPQVVSFVCRTAILERLTAPLCNALTGATDGADLLAELERENLFVTRLDDERCWYRFHPLFADVLRARLPEREVRDLHRCASAWYEASGMPDEALRHAVAGHDVERSIRLFRHDFEAMRSDSRSLLSRMALLPDETIRQHADLAACKAWLLYLEGATDEATQYRRIALAPAEAGARTRGLLETFEAYVELNWGEPARAAVHAREALSRYGDERPPCTIMALSYLGQAQALTGQRRAAIGTLRQAYQFANSIHAGGRSLDALLHVALLMRDEGRLLEAIELCNAAARRFSDAEGQPLRSAGRVHLALAALQYERDELPAARASLEIGLRLCRELGVVYYVLVGYRLQALLQLADGDREAAMATLAAARGLAASSGSPRRQHLADAMAADIQLRVGNLEAAARCVRDLTDGAGDTALHEVDMLSARLLVAQERFALALDLLDRLERAARDEGFEGDLISILVLRALSLRALGSPAAAVEALERALSLAACCGLRRVFVDHGPTLAPLLAEARAGAPELASSLLARVEALSRGPGGADALHEALTRKELQILALLDLGLKNREIAEQLGLTLGTTKQYVNRLFGKLGVRNRIEAITRARRLELLPGTNQR
jgi:LuxR family maltose regulon positive regulatory protein